VVTLRVGLDSVGPTWHLPGAPMGSWIYPPLWRWGFACDGAGTRRGRNGPVT